MSADPLAVHEPGEADANLYAYVSGMTLKSIDPLGLEKTQAEHMRDLDQGHRTNGEWNVAGPTLEHEPPAPPGTIFSTDAGAR